MMDDATLQRHASLCGKESTQSSAEALPALTPAEHAVYDALRRHTHGQALRLEQERIAWDYAWPALLAAIGAISLSSPTARPANPPA
jgi:hypothetical protein